MAVTLGNPKIMMFYMALLPTIIDLGSVTVAWLGRADGHHGAGADRPSTSPGRLAAAQARRLLKSSRAMRIANRVSATTMAGAAAAIATR